MNITIEKLNGDYSTKLNPKVKIDLLDFAEMIGAEIEIIEREYVGIARGTKKWKQYYAYFKNCEIKESNGGLTGITGDGNTINQALNDYAKKISGKFLVFDSDAGCMRRHVIAHKIIYKPSKKVKKMFSDFSKA